METFLHSLREQQLELQTQRPRFALVVDVDPLTSYMGKIRRDLKYSSESGHVETWIDKRTWEEKIANRKKR